MEDQVSRCFSNFRRRIQLFFVIDQLRQPVINRYWFTPIRFLIPIVITDNDSTTTFCN